MNRRTVLQYGVAASIPISAVKESHAFVNFFLALIGRASVGAVARVAGAARASALSGAAQRLRYNSVPQFSMSSASNASQVLSPRLRVNNQNSQQVYKSPRIYIREVNLNFNQSVEFQIPSYDFPPSFRGDFDVPLAGSQYVPGCDYMREIVSVDECGCEARWQPEAIAILHDTPEPSAGPRFSSPTIPPRDGPYFWRPGDHNPCPYTGTVPTEWVNGSVVCGSPRR